MKGWWGMRDGVIIREQRDDDLPAVHRVVTAAFADTGRVAALVDGLLARADCPAPGLVAEDAGEIVGYVLLSRSWVDAPDEVVDVLVLSPLGVAPSHQRQGIGTELVARAVGRAADLGAPAVFLEGDPAYYGRLGWEPGRTYGFSPPSNRIPDPGFQVVVLAPLPARRTGALVYNDTFWTHDCVGLRPDPTP